MHDGSSNLDEMVTGDNKDSLLVHIMRRTTAGIIMQVTQLGKKTAERESD
jgi:hypothetical protein